MATTENLPEDLSKYPDRITPYFEGKYIFITGGTGFMGKVFVEKLVRLCPKLGGFFLLVRPKKGKDPQERLREMFKNPLFGKIKSMYGEDYLDTKIRAIAGDCAEVDLGMSLEDRKLICEKVDYIIHCAATVRFDEPLKKALMLNTRGTKLMLELAKECKKLKLFGHVSTAYAFLKEKVLEERPYPPPTDPHKLIQTVENMDAEMVEAITDKILGGLPNTYCFTKALGECLVVEQFDKLPCVIIRPSVVIPIWKEPIPGWIDNINGPTGLLIGAGKGVIRTMHCDPTSYADFIPVDIAANCMALGPFDWDMSKGTRRIYNLTSSHEIRVSWNEIIDIGRSIVEKKIPLNGVAWYPGGSMKANKYHHLICMFFFHTIPAILVDTLLFCLGYKPILWRIQQRITKGFEMFEFYAVNQWIFENKNADRVRRLLNPRELEMYKVDSKNMDLEEYFTACVHSARLYILKETDDTLPAARKHMARMWWVDRITKTLFCILFIYLLFKYIFLPILGL